jgi:uncharacterized protein (TIRG00374 family)
MVTIPARWQRRFRVIKYTLALAALAWVLAAVEWERAATTLANFSVSAVAAVVVVSITGVAFQAATWNILITRFTGSDPLSALRVNLEISFINSVFPSRVSGRSVAPLTIRQYFTVAWNEAVAVTVAHTGLYALCYGLVALAGLALIADRIGQGIGAVVMISTLAYLASGAVVLLSGWRLDYFNQLVNGVLRIIRRFPASYRMSAAIDDARTALLERTDEHIRGLLNDRRRLGLFALGWVAALVIFPGLRFWFLLTEAGAIPVNPLLLPLVVVVAYSVTILPLTPGGIGVTEATAIAVFVALGVPQSVIVPVVFLDRLIGVYLPALAGWVPFVRVDMGP